MPQAKELVDVGVHHRATNQGLHMLADSSGVKFLGEGEWKTKKHGAERRRQWWCKVHLSIDAQTLQIRAIAATTNEVGDSPMAADLLGQIPNHEEVGCGSDRRSDWDSNWWHGRQPLWTG